jgi:hypothetical protein
VDEAALLVNLAVAGLMDCLDVLQKFSSMEWLSELMPPMTICSRK